jgi:hypothetical protein
MALNYERLTHLNLKSHSTLGGFKHEVQHEITIDETPLLAF